MITSALLLSSYLHLVDLQLLRNRLVATARSSMKKLESLGQVYGGMQDAYWKMQTPLVHQEPSSQVRGACGLFITLPFPFHLYDMITDNSYLAYNSEVLLYVLKVPYSKTDAKRIFHHSLF